MHGSRITTDQIVIFGVIAQEQHHLQRFYYTVSPKYISKLASLTSINSLGVLG
jgi:hypothetical protein